MLLCHICLHVPEYFAVGDDTNLYLNYARTIDACKAAILCTVVYINCYMTI